MILASSSLSSPGLTSTATPRSLKMATAAGESLSEMRTRGAMRVVLERRPVTAAKMRGKAAYRSRKRRSGPTLSRRLGELHLLEREGVVEPASQRLDVGGLDGRAAPDAQARRRVAIGADVEGDLLLLDETRDSLRERGLPVGGKRGDNGIDELQADAGVRAGFGDPGQEIDPRRARDPIGDNFCVRVGAGEQSLRSTERLRPLQRVDIVLDAQHRGRVDGLAFEKALGQFAALGKAEELRQGPSGRIGLEAFGGARREDDHPMRRLAAEDFLPGKGH